MFNSNSSPAATKLSSNSVGSASPENNPPPIRVDYINEKLDEGFSHTDKATGRDLILMIGNTGAGKSTTGNYLLGCKMKDGYDRHNQYIVDVDGEPIFPIQHAMTAGTLYAKPVSSPYVSWSLVDCPGFSGNRSIEDAVIESISIELAIRAASQVKGVLIFLSFTDIQGKAPELRGLMKTLVALFKDPIEMVQQCIFVITKIPPLRPGQDAKAVILGGIERLKEYYEEQMSKLPEDNPAAVSAENMNHQDYKILSQYFSEIQKQQDRVICVEPMDNGTSRQQILNAINGIVPRQRTIIGRIGGALKQAVGLSGSQEIAPITINDFNFGEYDQHRSNFNKAIYDRAYYGDQLIKKIKTGHKIVISSLKTIADCESRLEVQRNLKKTLSSGTNAPNSAPQRNNKIRLLSQIMKKNEDEISALEAEIAQLNTLIKDWNAELAKIDTDSALPFRSEELEKSAHFLGFLAWYKLDFIAETNDSVPIIKVVKSLENGQWYDEDDRRAKGVYKVTYKSNYYTQAKAKVTAYIKTKDEAGNKLKIKQLNADIEESTILIKDCQQKLADLTSTNTELQSEIELEKQGNEQSLEGKKQKLLSCEAEILRYEKKIKETKLELQQSKATSLEHLQTFNKERTKLEVAIKIAKLLSFPSSLVRNFSEEYKKFVSIISEYKTIFEGGALPSGKEIFTESEVDDGVIKDPLGGVIQTPVITTKGTIFDETTLLRQYSSEKWVYSHHHANGEVEVINYGEWTKVNPGSVPKIISVTQQSKKETSEFYEAQTPITDFSDAQLQELLNEVNEAMEKEIQEHNQRMEPLKIKQQRYASEEFRRNEQQKEVAQPTKQSSPKGQKHYETQSTSAMFGSATSPDKKDVPASKSNKNIYQEHIDNKRQQAANFQKK